MCRARDPGRAAVHARQGAGAGQGGPGQRPARPGRRAAEPAGGGRRGGRADGLAARGAGAGAAGRRPRRRRVVGPHHEEPAHPAGPPVAGAGREAGQPVAGGCGPGRRVLAGTGRRRPGPRPHRSPAGRAPVRRPRARPGRLAGGAGPAGAGGVRRHRPARRRCHPRHDRDHRGHGGGHHRDADRGVAAGNRPVDPGDLGAGVDGLPGRPGVDHLAADQLLVPLHQRRRHPRPAGRPAGPGRAAGGLLGRGGGPVPPPGHQRMTLYSRAMRPWKELATPRRVDLLIAAGLLVWGLPDVPWWWEYPGHAGSTPDVLGSLALTLAMSVPFCWRRAAPVPVLGLAAGVLAVRYGLHRDLTSAFAAVLVGAYGLGAYASPLRRYARWLGWLSLAAAVVVVVTGGGVPDKAHARLLEGRLAGAPLALLGAAFVLGDAADARRREAAALVESAHQAERTRIARELHDVVAHQLSAIAVQAGAARIAAGSGQVPAAGPAPGGGGQVSGDSGQAPGDVGQDSERSQAFERSQASTGALAEVLAMVERLAREALTEL